MVQSLSDAKLRDPLPAGKDILNQRGRVELGQLQPGSELKIEHNESNGTQQREGHNTDSAAFQAVLCVIRYLNEVFGDSGGTGSR